MTDPNPQPDPEHRPAPSCEVMGSIYVICHMMMRVLDRVAQPEGLTGSRWLLLMKVRLAPEPMTITQLSEALFISPQNVSRMVAALETEGLVVRDTSGPGRTVRVNLTPTGEDRVNTCAELAERCGTTMIDGVGPVALQHTIETLDTITTNIGAFERDLDATDPRAPRSTENTG